MIYKFGYELTLAPVSQSQYEKPIAFIHIAKCGGISIDNALRRQFAKPGEKRLCRTTSIAGSLASFGQHVDTLEGSCDFSEHHLKQLQSILRYYLDLQQSYISGHWGVTPELLEQYADSTDFITVLRDPVARFKSNYIFNKLSNGLSIMQPNKLNNDDLITEANTILFGRRGWQMANTQTAFITGRYPKNQLDAQNLQMCFEQQLKKFKVVGFLEKIDEFELSCQAKIGTKVSIKQRNKTNSLVNTQNKASKMVLLDYFSQKSVNNQLSLLCHYEQQNYLKALESY